MATRDHEKSLRCQQDSGQGYGEDMACISSSAGRIGTKGLFCFMELPVELRLKVRLPSGHPGPLSFCGKRTMI
jgi:hypothetical protein